MTEIAPHLQRVVEERTELADKRKKLEAFLDGEMFKKLPDADQELLYDQFDVMNEYHRILSKRLARAGVSD